MKRLFGTDGMRGEAGSFPLDERTIETVGRSLARQLREKHGRSARLLTGRDTRESGDWIERAFHTGAAAEGAACASAGVITTPGVAFLTQRFDFDAGVVVSASHNPYQDNGVKIFSPTGRKIDERTEREIEQDIFGGSASSVSDSRASDVDTEKTAEFQQSYLDYLAGVFPALSLEGVRLVVDCANGASSHLAPRLFFRLGALVTAINNDPDGRNINRDCGSMHLEHLQAEVLRQKADFGVAFDGDADRSLFVDEKGNTVDGDGVLWIMAQYLQEHARLRNQTVVATVMSNLGLEVALASRNIKLLRTSVGDKYVLEELLRSDASLGGEQSGHIIFPDKSLVGDGMLTSLFLLEAIREKGRSFSEMLRGFTRFPQILVNVKVREKRPFEEVAEISRACRQVEGELGEKGRLLLRYSGTENLARVMIEGEDQNRIEQQAHRLAEVIRASLG